MNFEEADPTPDPASVMATATIAMPAMAATTTTTATAIELGPYPGDSETAAGALQQRGARASSSDTAAAAAAEDPILEASRLADSTVPDGGFAAWSVIAACAVVSFWFTGVSYSWGVMQSALVADGVASASTLSWVGSIPPTLIAACAVPNARLVRAVGLRAVALAGVGIIVVAEIASGFCARSVPGLFVAAGALLGLGMSLCFTTCAVTPAQYFHKRRGLANGVVFAGGGLGGATVTILQGVLIQRFGVAWTYRVMGLVALATGVPAALVIKERNTATVAAGQPSASSVGRVEWQLFRDARFLLIFLTGVIATFPLLVPAFFLPLYAQSLGLSASVGAGLLAGFNFSSALGRVLCGLASDRLGSLNTLLLTLVTSGAGMLILWPASTTLGPLAVFAVLNGASNGGFFATMPTVVGNVFGSARVAVALGMVVTGWGPGYLMGAPIAGYLLDAYGGQDNGLQAYRPAMFYAGSLALGAAVLVVVMRLRMNPSLKARV
ncbi:major facilitator superfamily transporter [Purpureocillium lavendulum]|uniref:Major facilitator superfamily transporter n=1 Tax=Purpureocillium lavendulum TaxID=1247861 RepID=A0AB34FNW3_9HYPO|nr:major facilitator superfamily transporter [Purpureocillium lavendulum]